MKSHTKLSLADQIKANRVSPSLDNQAYLNPVCYKLGHKPEPDWQDCALFVRLRQQNCEKKKALIFSQQKRCRIDTSPTKIGPGSCRIPRLQQNSFNNYPSSFTDQEQSQDGKFISILHKQIDYDAAQRIRDLEKYRIDGSQLDEQHNYSLQKLTKLELLDKLKELQDIKLQEMANIEKKPSSMTIVSSSYTKQSKSMNKSSVSMKKSISMNKSNMKKSISMNKSNISMKQSNITLRTMKKSTQSKISEKQSGNNMHLQLKRIVSNRKLCKNSNFVTQAITEDSKSIIRLSVASRESRKKIQLFF